TLDAGDLGRSVLPGVAPGADAGHGVAVLVGLLNVQVRGPTTTPPGAADHLIVVLILGVAASGAARGALAGRVAAVGAGVGLLGVLRILVLLILLRLILVLLIRVLLAAALLAVTRVVPGEAGAVGALLVAVVSADLLPAAATALTTVVLPPAGAPIRVV